MERTIISATEARRRFFRVLREVRDGQSYAVTAHGRAVALIVPFGGSSVRREAARSALLKRLSEQEPSTAVGWTRGQLYDR